MNESADHVLPPGDDGVTEAERDLVSEALLGALPTLEEGVWARLLSVATDPDTPDPGAFLVSTPGVEDLPFDVSDPADLDDSTRVESSVEAVGHEDHDGSGDGQWEDTRDYGADDDDWAADDGSTTSDASIEDVGHDVEEPFDVGDDGSVW